MSTQFALPQPFLRTKEAARFTGLSYRTLEKHRRFGTGPRYNKVGRRVLYAASDLTEWIKLGAKRSTSEPETVPPAKPIDPVKRVKQVPDSAIVVEVEATGPVMLGIPEAARFLRLSVHTLQKYRTKGIGPNYSNVGRRIFYAESDLTDWVELDAKRSTSDPETVLPAKPVDQVKRVKQVPDSTIVVEFEAAEPARPVDEANLVEPAPDCTSAAEREAVGVAKHVDDVNQIEPVPDNAIVVEGEAAEAAKLGAFEAILGLPVQARERHCICGTGPTSKLPSVWMVPSATSATHGRKSACRSRPRSTPIADPAWIAPIPPGWQDSEASRSSNVSTKLKRFPVISKRLRRRRGQGPGPPDNWERRDKRGDRWLRYDAKRWGTALVGGSAR